jgi:hypothetical protein|tara:strand:+ start:231 stop:683 length:453 start_codon:yes stop_codon:yes gene_type:complete
MKKYITFIITAALLLGTSVVQADHHSKTNKAATVKGKKPTAKKVNPNDARKRYAAAAKKIRDAVKAGKLTPQQAKEKQTALRKRMALQRFDKNKDGKLCEKEQAAMKKALAERKNKDTKRGKLKRGKPDRREQWGRSRRGGDKSKRPTRK